MIESNIIEWLDFGESILKIESHSNKLLKVIFQLFRELLKNRFSLKLYIIFILIYFMQLYCLSVCFISYDNDIVLEILDYLKNIFVVSSLINDYRSYVKFLIAANLILYLDILLMIIILFKPKTRKSSYYAYLVNLINMIILYYFIGPALDVNLISFMCQNGKHQFLQVKCFSDKKHILNFTFSLFLLLLYILVASLYSIFCNEVGSININKDETFARIDCNYEFFITLDKIILVCIFFIIRIYPNNSFLKLLFISAILLMSIFMSFYVYKYVYYYNNIINYINYLGWFYSSWLFLCIFLKIIFKLNNISNSIIIGWAIIPFTLYIINKTRTFSLITEANILEFKDIKLIEIYNNMLLNLLLYKTDFSSKILLYGIIKNFEENISNMPEINYHYHKLINNKYLKEKLNNEIDIYILAIIYILYIIHLEKSISKEDIAIYMSYFLINKLNNPEYAILLLSKIKVSGIRIYYKYLLTEDIKEYLISKLDNNTKNSIKQIQIGSMILYYLYLDLFKFKIYDGISHQIDYFDILKNNINSNKTMPNFIKTSVNILETKKDIMKIWNKIIELNPFSDESYKDYMFYLDTIIQDDILIREESKNYMQLKGNKIEERDNVYHNIFLKDSSSIILIDGYFIVGKILYSSPNFSLLFSYNSNEILNLNIDDLLPNTIQSFHKDLIEDAIKYSNINYIFKKQKDSLLKNKNGGLFDIKLYVKAVPNISYGLIYYAYLQKKTKSNFIIILDKDFRINGFTERENSGAPFTIHSGYNLTHALYGCHIGLLIPDILPMLVHKNDEFNIIKKNLDLKGYLYQINTITDDLKQKVDNVLKKIKDSHLKNNNISKNKDENYEIINEEFADLISELNNQKLKVYSIFYKVEMFSFLDDKYRYYKIMIIDDIITGNEGNQIIKKNVFKKSISLDNKKYSSKIIPENNNIIKKKIKIGKRIQNNNNENNNINIEKENEINDKVEQNQDSIDNTGKNTEKNKEKTYNEEKDISKKNNKNYQESLTNFHFIKNGNDFNKIKDHIMKKKEGIPIIIMKIMALFFGIITIFLVILNYRTFMNNINDIEIFCYSNALFNLTKISVGAIYLITSNIKWEIHNCFLSTNNQIIYNDIYESLLLLNINFLLKIRNQTSEFGPAFNNIWGKKYLLELNVYGTDKKENFVLNSENYVLYIINSAINLLNSYKYLIDLSKNEKNNNLNPLSFGYNELLDLENITYLFFNNPFLEGFSSEEVRKKNQVISSYYPIICNSASIIIILIVYILIISKIHNIIIFFLERIINFNSKKFDNYLKNLDDIKKKFQNENKMEEEKDELDINDSDIDNSRKIEENEKKDLKNSKSAIKKKKNSKKKNPNKDGKILKQRNNKFKSMTSFFIKTSIFLVIRILFLMIISLIFYIISMAYELKAKNNFLYFNSINADIIGTYKESFKIFLGIRNELVKFENSLVKCEPGENNVYKLDLEKIKSKNFPNFHNCILQIKSDFDLTGKNLDDFILLYDENIYEALFAGKDEINWYSVYINGILSKGMEQSFTEISSVYLTIIQEIDFLNGNATLFKDFFNKNHLLELFIQFLYQKAAIYSDENFEAFREEILEDHILMMKIVLIIYLYLTFLITLILLYIVQKANILLMDFLNFFGILPLKYLTEDEKLYNEIISFGNEYFS